VSTARQGRARTQSLCGTARGIASRKTASELRAARRRPCRYAAIWSCQKSVDCAARMASRRMPAHRR
jgi:hypothetical protein